MNWRIDYWRESLECALDTAGAWGVLTPEVIEIVAKSLATSAENESMASRSICAPNPMNAEIANLRREIDRLTAESERVQRIFVNNVARRRGIHPSQVYLDGDNVMIAP